MAPMSASLSLGAAAQSRAGVLIARLRRITGRMPWPICAITLVAALLRFIEIESVSANAFYDAAVRSMGLSLHNFLFGAFDPAGLLSIDKPPLDLWLQVLSVKLFGWGQFSLRLPEALAGTAAVPLLYDTVRRVAGRPAGLAAGFALAVFPESVLTARSDTMDSVMMLLVLAALWMVLRAAQEQPGRRRVIWAGVLLGLAFNVKLLQSLIALPAIGTLYMLAAPGPARRKLADLRRGAAALVAVGLSWAVLITLAPGHHPWALGSSDGSIWNAMFVFNGVGKIGHAAASTKPGGPGPFRLLVSTGWHYDLLFGCVLVAALALGVAGAVLARPAAGADTHLRAARARRLVAAFSVSLVVWIAFALLVFDTISTVHARYLEAFSPALAAVVGLGAAALAGFIPTSAERRPPALRLIAVALLCTCLYTFALGSAQLAWAGIALLVATIGAVLITRAGGPVAGPARWLTAGLIVACGLLFPVHESLSLVRAGANDSLGLAIAPASEVSALSAFLRPRTGAMRYELAVDDPTSLAPLIIRDARPILPLTSSFEGRPLIGLAQLQRAVADGQVRYGLVGAYRCSAANAGAPACGPAARWIRQTGLDVTRSSGALGHSKLYLLRSPDAPAVSAATG